MGHKKEYSLEEWAKDNFPENTSPMEQLAQQLQNYLHPREMVLLSELWEYGGEEISICVDLTRSVSGGRIPGIGEYTKTWIGMLADVPLRVEERVKEEKVKAFGEKDKTKLILGIQTREQVYFEERNEWKVETEFRERIPPFKKKVLPYFTLEKSSGNNYYIAKTNLENEEWTMEVALGCDPDILRRTILTLGREKVLSQLERITENPLVKTAQDFVDLCALLRSDPKIKING